MTTLLMTLLAILAFMAICFTIAVFAVKTGKSILAYAGAGCWILIAVIAYTSHITMWDVYYGLFMFAAVMTFTCAILPVLVKEKEEITEEDIPEEDRQIVADIQASEADRDRYDRLYGRRKRHNKSSKRLARFAKTGRT